MLTNMHAPLVRWLWPALVALGGLWLGACASTPVWDKAGGVTQAQWQRDSYECERDARMSTASFGGGVVGQVRAEQFYARCLQAKGYYRVK